MEAPGCQAAAASASGTAAGEVAAGLLAGGAAGEPAGCDLRLKFCSSSRSCIICTLYRTTISTSGKERIARLFNLPVEELVVLAKRGDRRLRGHRGQVRLNQAVKQSNLSEIIGNI